MKADKLISELIEQKKQFYYVYNRLVALHRTMSVYKEDSLCIQNEVIIKRLADMLELLQPLVGNDDQNTSL